MTPRTPRILRIKKSSENSATECARTLKAGSVVIIPTDTVYGLSAIAQSPIAQDDKGALAIRAIKGREQEKPFIVLIAEPSDAFQYTNDAIPKRLFDLWPCALTIVVRASEKDVPSAKTIALRCPGDKWLRDVIRQCGKPIYSTSANVAGRPPLHSMEEIEKESAFAAVSLIVDGGIEQEGKAAMPSTIVSVADGQVKVLRQGSLRSASPA